MIPQWIPPAYLVTVPQVVPSNSDDDTSDGEEENGKFSVQDFKNPPFAIDWESRGKVVKQDELISQPQTSYESEFIKKVEQESFGKAKNQVRERVGVVIGHNRMLSLSKSVNRLLVEQSKKFAKKTVVNEEIHFFWRPQWIRIEQGRKVKVEWETVHNFYRQFKKYNPEKARRFRQEREGLTPVTEEALKKFYAAKKKLKITAEDFFKREAEKEKIPRFTRDHIRAFEEKLKKKIVKDVDGYVKLLQKTAIIPYREIREHILTHEKTEQCAKVLQKDKKRPLYIAIQDGDVGSMQNLFTHYDLSLQWHLQKHRVLPEVASGGYQVKDPLNPILEIGVLIDLWVRHYTAQLFPKGVYYPEPNTLVRLKEGETKLEASFLGKGKYTSPLEMPTLIDDLIKKRNIQNLSSSFLFDATAALTTAIPKRMERRFSAFYNSRHKVVRWSVQDLKIYKSVSQTHYKNMSWVKNICTAIGLPKQLEWTEGFILSKKELEEIVVSLISRLFSTYDPFEVSRRSGSGFQKSMIALLNHGKLETLPLAPNDKIRDKAGSLGELWKEIDAIGNVEQLLKYLDRFFEKPNIGRQIQQAALQSMKAAAQIFKGNLSLNFTELSIAAMMSLEKARDFIEEMRVRLQPRPILTPQMIGSPLHRYVLEVMVEPDWEGKLEYKKKLNELPEDQRQGYLGTYPMHWAAMTGNLQAVRFFKWCKNWASAFNQPGDNGLLPIHCALRYCADNGEDLNLIRELATKNLLNRKTMGPPDPVFTWTQFKVLRESPLLQAIEELYHYPETLKLLFQFAEIDQDTQEDLLDLAEKMEEDAEGKFEPKKILDFAIKENCSPEVIQLLIEWGAEFRLSQDCLERDSPFAIAIDDEYGSESDRLALIDILSNAGYNLCLEDNEGLTPLGYAIQKENLPIIEKLVVILEEAGAPISEEEYEQIDQIRQNRSQKVRRLEPLDEGLELQLDEVIGHFQTANGLTDRERAKLIKQFEQLKERNYHYDDQCFGNRMRSARKNNPPN